MYPHKTKTTLQKCRLHKVISLLKSVLALKRAVWVIIWVIIKLYFFDGLADTFFCLTEVFLLTGFLVGLLGLLGLVVDFLADVFASLVEVFLEAALLGDLLQIGGCVSI